MPAKGSIHCHDYNEDVFPCVQFFRTYDRFDAPTFVEYLKAMQKHFGKVAAVVDRASPHRAKLRLDPQLEIESFLSNPYRDVF